METAAEETPTADDRAKATEEAMKIVNAPVEKKPTVPDLLRANRELFHEKGLDGLWMQLDDASGNEASKPEAPPEGTSSQPASDASVPL